MKSWFTAWSKLFRFFLIPILLAYPLGNSVQAASQRIYTYANGVKLPLAAQLPIFHVTSPAVNANVTQLLTQDFSSIYDHLLTPQPDTTNGHPRFTLFNQTNDAVLEQFGATGGFYAYNPDRAFGKTGAGAVPSLASAQMLACLFLLNHYNSLVPAEPDLSIPGVSDLQCSNNFSTNPLYKVSTEWLTSQNAAAANSPSAPAADTPLRVMVTLPINLNVGVGAPLLIPLGGPGGHISMIFFNPTDQTIPSTLDANSPGLQAIAMPAHGRTFTFNRMVTTVDPAAAQTEVLSRVMAAYPDATNVNIPAPALEYDLSDASTPQVALEPDLDFVGVSLFTGGQTLTLKDIVLPAVVSGPGGSGPTVDILSPVNGSFYFPGVQVALQGKITNGLAPYNYDWQLEDGTSIKTGSTAAAGLLPLFTTSLPVPPTKGSPGSLSVHLVVTDADGITREGVVSFNSPIQVFMPLVANGSNANSPAAAAAAPVAPAAPNSIHTFGVEYGSDYPPYGPGGPDLGGVPPDANGFSAGLWSLGYARVFNWYNANAWEKDWRDCSLGGGDCSYGVDRAEFVYYSGHGNNGGIAIPSNSHDSSWFDGINARYSTARWVGFSSCLTLRAQWPTPADAPIRRWFNAFQGAHMLLGFNSTMGDIAFGGPLVDNMRMPYILGIVPEPWAQRTIAGAWVQTAFEMNAGKPAYIYAWTSSEDPSLDKLPQWTDASLPRPYPPQWYYWVWWDE